MADIGEDDGKSVERSETGDGNGGGNDEEGPYIGTDIHEGIQALYEDKKLTDVTIVIDSQKFPCHRLVLASISPFFRSMFTSDFKEKSQDEVQLQSVSAEIFQHILHFIYANDKVIENNNVQELLKAACMFGIRSLQYDCENFMMDEMTFDDSPAIWKFAKAHSCERLVGCCRAKLTEKFDEFSKTENFLNLDKEDVVEMMQDPDLQTEEEENTAEAVIKWILHRSEERQVNSVLFDVLEYVKFPLMQPEYLFELTERHPFLYENNEVRSLLDEAKRYHCSGVRRHEISSHRTHYRYQSKFTNVMYSVKVDATPSLYAYSFQEENWAIKPLATPFLYGIGAASCIQENNLYVHGGLANARGCLQKYVSQLNLWIKYPHSGQRQYYHALVSVRQSLYAIGGCEVEHNIVTGKVMQFDIPGEIWTRVLSAELPIPICNFSATAIDSKIYIFGGRTREEAGSFKIQCFDTCTRQTSVFGDSPVPVLVSGAITVDKTVYFASGAGEIIQWTPNDGGLIVKSVLLEQRHRDRGSRLCYFNKKLIVFSTFDRNQQYGTSPYQTVVENCSVDLDSGDIVRPWYDTKLKNWGRADRCSMHLCIAPSCYFNDSDEDDPDNDEDNHSASEEEN